MAISIREEQRALDGDEKDIVAKTHHPAIRDIDDKELRALAGLLRSRRDRARAEAHRRRRELRGKAEPKGAKASAGEAGSHLKVDVLAMAMRRLNNEVERRRRLSAKTTLADNARRALSLKQGTKEAAGSHPNSRSAHEGMRAVQNEKAKNLIRPMELGRQRQAAKVAQARRDSRPG